jgi:endonuclease/exonuclease/phosphatase family metal-dependent hydrolase
MKLISLNLEGKRHLNTALPFLETQSADAVCLMEAPEDMQQWLIEQGYFVTFAPMVIRTQDSQQFADGVILASKQEHSSEIFYYHRSAAEVTHYEKNNKRATISHPVIFASIGEFNLATTHFTWNPVGETADQNQTTDLKKLLEYLRTKPAHMLCGDFNIPRNYNVLYKEIIKQYTDTVPSSYESSLDADHHRARKDPDLQKLFTHFMVDYLFTQPPYAAFDVRLQFGVSDHAAVVTEITRRQVT